MALMFARFYAKYKLILWYAPVLAALLFLLKWLEMKLLVINHAFELYAGLIALLFTGLGIWLALKLAKPKVQTVWVEVEKPAPVTADIPVEADKAEIARLGISPRELDVLRLMAGGLSNREIAGRLFVSENTVKTHSSNLFIKLEAKRRTQAVEIAKRLNIIT